MVEDETTRLKRAIPMLTDLAYSYHKLLQEVHELIEKKWGVDYSDIDADEIIDAFEYANATVSYDDVVRIMNKRTGKKLK